MLMHCLQNKVALVTGASRGIGRAIALALAKAGATVIGTATTETSAAQITASLQSSHQPGVGKVLDVSQNEQIETLVASLKAQYGMIHILINNAAITQDNLLLRMKETEWSRVIETNLNAIYYLSKACVREMIKARWGRIITIGSIVGTTGNAGQTNYAAAKAGIIGFSKSLALEIGSRNVTVNVVAPGFIATDMTNVLTADQQTAILNHIPMNRPGTAEEVASAALFFASPMADYITGQTLHVNGGMYMS